MANPYHDADGKFCSRGEMVKAIETALEKQKIDTYFELRRDLELIDANKVEVSQVLFGQLMDKNTAQKQKDRIEVDNPEDYRSVYQTIIGSDEDAGTKHKKLNTLLMNNEIPVELRQEIIDNADTDTQLAIIRSAGARRWQQNAPQALLTRAQAEYLISQNISNSNAIQDALQQEFPLSDERKLELAEKKNWGLSTLVESNPHLLHREGMEQKVVDKMNELKETESHDYGDYARVLARHSKNADLVRSLVEENTPGASEAALHNRALSGATAALAFSNIAKSTYQLRDMERIWRYEFQEGFYLYRDADDNARPGISWSKFTQGSKLRDGSPTTTEVAAITDADNKNVSYSQAIVDSYKGNYVKLQAKLFKEEKLSRKVDNVEEVKALKLRLETARMLSQTEHVVEKLRKENRISFDTF